MTIKVPFAYEANIIKHKCRNPIKVLIQDSINIKIKEFSKNELPVAFKNKSEELLYDGKSLWTINYDKDADSKELYTVNSKTVMENTENGGENYKYSSSSPEAPFLNFWWEAKCRIKDKLEVPTKHEQEKECRSWENDNRLEIIKRIKEVANNLIFVDNILYAKSKEPMYVVQSFGCGRNYSVALSVTYFLNPNIDKRAYFNVLDLELAKEFAFKKSSTPNIYADIEVLIPQAAKFKRRK